MDLTFVRKEPDKAYVAERLWLPKNLIRVEPVKGALEFTIPTQTGPELRRMWAESAHHLICPREFLPASEYSRYKFPFVDLRPSFQKVDFEDSIEPKEDQLPAWESLKENDNGILNLACGKGKTVLAAKKIAQKGTTTLVVVPDGAIYTQWENTIAKFLKFKGELGSIRGPVFSWAKPITLALVTTLWQRIEQGSIPEEMFRYFGLVLYDEVHQIGAPKFSLTATPFYGDRIGLTATVQREDGLDPIYRYHIGEPFFSDLSQELVPRIYFQQTPLKINHELAKMAGGVTNVSILRTMLGRSFEGNVYRYWKIKEAVDAGRKVLCLSHSIDQLRLMSKMFPGAGVIIGETPQKDRFDILRNSRICFAIAKLGSVGVDDPKLDTLFWLTPFRSKISLQQSMGRVQRECAGKFTPVVVVFEDFSTPTIRKLCLSLRHSLKQWGYVFDTCPPEKVPSILPPGVASAYNKEHKNLPSKGEICEED